MTVHVRAIEDEKLRFFGLRGAKNTVEVGRHNREAYRGRGVTSEHVDEWLTKLTALLDRVEAEFSTRQLEMLDPLHDPIRLAKQISTIANTLVGQMATGDDLQEKIQNAPIELKSLVKAADLLSDSFQLLEIYFNPEAASFGKKHAINLHGLLTKLVAIFRVDDGRANAPPKIYISGSCFRSVSVYESFKLIPFALLANAVKYTMAGAIQVRVDDRRTHVEVQVESTGPYIETDERDLIFQKGRRGRWAFKIGDGRGVGLYLARVIATAHELEIEVSSSRTKQMSRDVPLAVNTFTVRVPTSGH